MIKEAFKLSFVIGISPDVFWTLTPWQFGCCIEAYEKRFEQNHNHDVWVMWHGEALQRTKKLPRLVDMLKDSDKKEVQGIDEAGIIDRLKAYKEKMEKK